MSWGISMIGCLSQTQGAAPFTSGITTYTSGSGTFTVPAGTTQLEYLVVGGGGGGGQSDGGINCAAGGGGGAGGYLTGVIMYPTGNYPYVVAAQVNQNTSGNISSFTGSSASIIAYGGGRGGFLTTLVGANGASGGGGGVKNATNNNGGTATPAGQGSAGGQGGNFAYSAGGGGANAAGARAVGTNSWSGGGAGKSNSISGGAVTYAVGGNGFAFTSGSANYPGADGTANRGNGGAGGGDVAAGGKGASGIIILKYTNPSYPTSGLTALWTFNNTLADTTNTYTLTDSETASYAVGKINNCLKMSAGGKTLKSTDVNLRAVYSGTSQYTFSTWVKQTTVGDIDMFSCNDDGSNEYWMDIYVNGSNWYCQKRSSGAGDTQSFTQARSNAVWYHVVKLFNGTNTIYYVNNVQKLSIAENASIPVGSATYFGVCGLFGAANTFFDQTFVYNRALSTAEIAVLYNNGYGI